MTSSKALSEALLKLSTLGNFTWFVINSSLILFFFVAVFVPGYDVITSYTSLLGLHQCNRRFRDRVTVHLVYPLSHPPAENTLGHFLEQALRRYKNCGEFMTSLKSNDLQGKHSLNYANNKVWEILYVFVLKASDQFDFHFLLFCVYYDILEQTKI